MPISDQRLRIASRRGAQAWRLAAGMGLAILVTQQVACDPGSGAVELDAAVDEGSDPVPPGPPPRPQVPGCGDGVVQEGESCDWGWVAGGPDPCPNGRHVVDLIRGSLTNGSGMCADLSGADLSRMVLRNADLSGADLSGADLSLADLSGANLSGANLSGANLSVKVNLRGANLSGADLTGADLATADLTEADLTGANLATADLLFANLNQARAHGANFYRAKNNYNITLLKTLCPETCTCYPDGDGDGFGGPLGDEPLCENTKEETGPPGDCNDGDEAIKPGAVELCDAVDNDCDGSIDEDDVCGAPPPEPTCDDGVQNGTETAVDCGGSCAPASLAYMDNDGDGLGDSADEGTLGCTLPAGFAANHADCDDADPDEPRVAAVGALPAEFTGLEGTLPTIQEAIEAADKCVLVMPGTYPENLNFSGKNLAVTSAEGAAKTVIDGGGAGSVVTFANGETSVAVLDGFTVQNGTGTLERTVAWSCPIVFETVRYYGGGIFIEGASPKLHNLVVRGNVLPDYAYSGRACASDQASGHDRYVYSYGGGIFVGDATIEMQNVTVSENAADDGGGLYINSASTVEARWTSILGNQASGGGGYSNAGTLNLHNVILADNSSHGSGSAVGGAAGTEAGGTANWSFVTAVGNEGLSQIYLSSGGSINLESSTLSDNDSGYGLDGEVGTTASATYSNVYGCASGNYGSEFAPLDDAAGNISEDPEFVMWSDDLDPENDDLHLAVGSALVQAGDGGQDIGAYGGPDGSWTVLRGEGAAPSPSPPTPACEAGAAGGPLDADADGFVDFRDCDDNNAAVNPGALEVWYDGVDQNCDCNDADQDGDGVLGGVNGPDCDDMDPNVSADCSPCVPVDEACDDGRDNDCDGQIDEGCPQCDSSDEVCDGFDNDCDGVVDNGVMTTFYEDSDGDGFGNPNLNQLACAAPDGYVANDTDCDDSSLEVYPGAPEACDDGVDNDCDGVADDGCPVCGNGMTEPGEDCDDDNANPLDGCHQCHFACAPVAEVCDGTDNDCDGMVDAADDTMSPCADAGVCQGGQCVADCVPAQEVCDGIDNDCDGAIDAADATMSPCADGGVCRDGACIVDCAPAQELCDGVDNDCDGMVDAADGTMSPCADGGVCQGGQCVANCVPVAEVCGDLRDNDCDGQVDNGCAAPCEHGTVDGQPVAEGCGTCDAPWPMRVDGSTWAGSTPAGNLAPALGTHCGQVGLGSGYEAVHVLPPAFAGPVCIHQSVEPGNQLATLYVREGDCARAPEVQCDTLEVQGTGAEVQFLAEPGRTYYIVADTDPFFPPVRPLAYTLVATPGPCPDPAGSCGEDADCPAGQYCDISYCYNARGTCQDPPPRCFGQADCPPSMVCAGARCARAPADQVLTCDPVLYPATCECGGLAPCLPTHEICNGLDDDCDGLVDDGLAGCEPCVPTPGPDLCDGLDGDCDGQVDEDGAAGCDDGFACTVDVCRAGACANMMSQEVCNGRDDDCDGSIDEGLQCGGCTVIADCAAGEMCLAGECVADTCPPDLQVIEVAGDHTYPGSSVGAPDLFDSSCVVPGAPEVAFTFVAPAAMTVCIDTVGSNYDTILDVEPESCGAQRAVCNDDLPGGVLQSSVRLDLLAGVRYNVRVEGFQGASGDYVLHVGPCL
jgi:hypothetical protein